MALIKYGGGIIQMSGSIAGNTYARNRYGNYARARTKPTNPNTERQQVVKNAMAFLTTRWSATLTAAQRTAWNLYASNVAMLNKLGETIHLSGSNHYLRSNMIRKQTSNAIIDAGPVVFEIPEADPTFTLTASEATQQLSFAFDNTMDWSVEDGSFLFCFEGQPQNAQRNFFAGPWRYAGARAGIDPGGGATPMVVGTQYGISEGQRLWGYGRIARADGRISQPFRADTFCAA